jgi:hypothetical protein
MASNYSQNSNALSPSVSSSHPNFDLLAVENGKLNKGLRKQYGIWQRHHWNLRRYLHGFNVGEVKV